ncbi:MFS transporter [Shewanella baltica]|uniref:MFS transporter n=1 Tax=Shewanella baltica TaxID=62322 RepID=UPI003218CE6F
MSDINLNKITLPPIWMLVFFYGFASFASVLLAPSLPDITQRFHVSPAQAQWVMSVFLIGYAFAPILFGPISNHYGRKPTALAGILISLGGCLIQYWAFISLDFNLLVWGRLINAFGAASGLVLGMTMVSDSYQGNQSRRVMAMLTLMQAFFPGAAIFIGGSLSYWFGLKSLFYFLLGFNVVVLIFISLFKETLPLEQHQKIHIFRILKGYYHEFKRPQYLSYVSLVCVASASINIFNSFAPIVTEQYTQINSQSFGVLSLITSSGLILGALIVSKLSHKYNARLFLCWGMALIMAASALLLIIFYVGIINIYSIFTPAFFLFLGVAFVLPNGSMSALSGSSSSALASGMLLFMSLLTGAATIYISGGYIEDHILTLPITLLILCATGATFYLFTRNCE